jgi:zinc transport system ATP-binding protein
VHQGEIVHDGPVPRPAGHHADPDHDHVHPHPPYDLPGGRGSGAVGEGLWNAP